LSISNPVSNVSNGLWKDREERKGGREGGTVRNEKEKLREVLEARKKSSQRGWLAG